MNGKECYLNCLKFFFRRVLHLISAHQIRPGQLSFLWQLSWYAHMLVRVCPFLASSIEDHHSASWRLGASWQSFLPILEQPQPSSSQTWLHWPISSTFYHLQASWLFPIQVYSLKFHLRPPYFGRQGLKLLIARSGIFSLLLFGFAPQTAVRPKPALSILPFVITNLKF